MFQAQALLNLILARILLNWYYNPPFTEEETQANWNNLSTAK